jgi:hypothetical protein
MAHPEGLSQWAAQVARELPQLSAAQARVLAWWSYGIVFTRSCACPTVAVFLGLVLGRGYHALRQCLREWCYAAADKRGTKRQALDVTTCFAPLLGWVLRLWTGQQLALALDATSLGERFVVLTVSVVYRGCAIPVAWRVLPANRKGAWRREWLRLLRLLRPAVPAHYQVRVLADRGLYARWLFRRIVRLGWHPFLRVNRAGKFRPAGQQRWVWFGEVVPPVGRAWVGQGLAFVSRESRLACTLVACWEPGHREAWFVLTDLLPGACRARWYGLRAWIEQGFKVTKRGGWQWHQTRMTDPARAERLWLALAVATLWVVSVGDAFEQEGELPVIQDLVASAATGQRPRLVRLFRLGLLMLLAALATRQALPLPRRLSAQTWPGAEPSTAPPIPQGSTCYAA